MTTTLQQTRAEYAKEKGYVRSEWLYMGRRMGSSGAVVYAWFHDDEEAYYKKNWVRRPGVGSVYEFYTSADGMTIATGGTVEPLFLRMVDDPRVPKWHAEDQMTAARIEAERVRKRLTTNAHPMGELTLDAIATQYRSLATADQRAGMMAAIIKHLQRGV